MTANAKECSICISELINSRLLPCTHSFCLDCLDRYCRSLDKLPGDNMTCPECRTLFQIPNNGVADLTVRTHARESATSSAVATNENECSMCHDELNNPRLLPCSHSFCFDCLELYCRSLDRMPGDDVPCPECETDFQTSAATEVCSTDQHIIMLWLWTFTAQEM